MNSYEYILKIHTQMGVYEMKQSFPIPLAAGHGNEVRLSCNHGDRDFAISSIVHLPSENKQFFPCGEVHLLASSVQKDDIPGWWKKEPKAKV